MLVLPSVLLSKALCVRTSVQRGTGPRHSIQHLCSFPVSQALPPGLSVGAHSPSSPPPSSILSHVRTGSHKYKIRSWKQDCKTSPETRAACKFKLDFQQTKYAQDQFTQKSEWTGEVWIGHWESWAQGRSPEKNIFTLKMNHCLCRPWGSGLVYIWIPGRDLQCA